MGKHTDKTTEPTQAQKAEAIARALKEIEAKYGSSGALHGARAQEPAEDDEESKARKQKAVEAARQNMEAWMRDPPWFSFYSPYLSVLHGGTPHFVDRKGEKLTFRSPHSATQLLYLAKEAADEYLGGNRLSEGEWRDALADWKKVVKDMKSDIAKANFEFRDPLGNSVTPKVDDMGPYEVISIAFQLLQAKLKPGEETPERNDAVVGVGFFHQLWCLVCLSEIDSAVLSVMYEDAGDGIDATIRATQALGNARECRRLTSTLLPSRAEQSPLRDALVVPLRKEFALAGAKAKLAKDPKQVAKREVKQWWFRWRENPDWYQGKSSFARAMLDKYPDLTSQPVIEGWCREWEKEVGSRPAQSELN